MKTILLSALLLAAPAAAAPAELALKGYLSAWTQACRSGACELPRPGERNRPVELALALPSAPGEAAAASREYRLQLPGGGELAVDLDLYAVCPYGGAQGACAGRYFQAQASLSGPAAAFCSAALNEKDFAPFPVLTCAGAAGGVRYGVTLHRLPL